MQAGQGGPPAHQTLNPNGSPYGVPPAPQSFPLAYGTPAFPQPAGGPDFGAPPTAIASPGPRMGLPEVSHWPLIGIPWAFWALPAPLGFRPNWDSPGLSQEVFGLSCASSVALEVQF